MQQEIIANTPRRIRLCPLMPGVLRVTQIPASSRQFPPERPWMKHVFLHLHENPEEMVIKTGNLKACLEEGRLHIRTETGESLLCEAQPCLFSRSKKLQISWKMEKGERFYGGGEWFNEFGRMDGRLRLYSQESLSLMQGSRTYSTIPFFLSSRNYGLFVLSSRASTWTFDPEKKTLMAEIDETCADYIVFHGRDLKEIIQSYTALTGRPPLLPKWAFGLWVTSYPQDHQDAVIAHARQHRERNIPLDAVILDYHWEDRFHNFRWRKSLIPEPEKMLDMLHRMNLHTGLITTPFVNHRNQPLKKIGLQILAHDIPPGMVLSDDRALPEYQEAKKAGYLAHENAEWWFGRGGMIDFTNPAACAWWNRMANRLYAQGVDFFKNDDGEYLPEDAGSVLGLDGKEYHNLYGFYYGRAIYEGRHTFSPTTRPMIYARSVWAGSQRYPALFMGDQKPTYECMLRTLRAGLNLSLLGFAYWTADVFGLDGKTTEEMHMRYAQWALFTPVARYFWRPPRVDDTRFPWSHGAENEENFRRLAHLRYRLLPVYYQLAWEACCNGFPILRPMLFEFPEDRRFATCADQYMLGNSLLFAPVVKKQATRRKVILPAGRWHDFWSHRIWEGPQEVEVGAPIDHLPLFMRGGCIIPLGPAMDFIPDEHRFDHLTLHVLSPLPAKGWLYEDDGVSMDYQKGAYRQTHFMAYEDEDSLTLRIETLGAGFSGCRFDREVEIVLHGIAQPQRVIADTGKVEMLPPESGSSVVHLMVTQPGGCSMQLKIFL